jgi:acyl-CoA thioester hydrolase
MQAYGIRLVKVNKTAQQVSASFRWPVRVYYEDTDGGGVVYHANYLKFMERARTEWLRYLGFEQTDLRQSLGVLFVVRRLSMQYRRPATFNDELVVETRLRKMGHSLLEFEQVILRNGDKHTEQLTEAVVEVVCVETGQFKPATIPDSIRNVIKMMEPA